MKAREVSAVDSRTHDDNSVLRSLSDDIRLSMYSPDAMGVGQEMTDIVTMRKPARRPVVARGEYRTRPDRDCADVCPIACRTSSGKAR